MGATAEQSAIIDEQQQLTLAAVDRDLGIVEQLRGLLTDQVLVVLGMVLLGAVFGIACAGAARLWKYRLDPDLPAREHSRRILTLQRIAFAAGSLWTAAILVVLIEADLSVRLLMAVCLGPIAGLATPYVYDLLRWAVMQLAPAIGKWLLERVKALLGIKGDGPPPAS